MAFQSKGIAAGILSLFSFCAALLGQSLQIVSPADDIIVNSGHTLIVSVNADPSLFQAVIISCSCSQKPVPSLDQPPYRYSISIAPDAPSGVCSIAAIGTPKSGAAPSVDTISVKVERPDLPLKLTPTFPALYLSYVGQVAPRMDILGRFADGSLVLLNNSAYLSYSSDAPPIAKVEVNGALTAVAPGSTALTIRYGNASIGTTSVRVPVHVPYPVTVNPPTVSVEASQTQEFSVTLNIDPRLDQTVRWSISPSFGAIDDHGRYTAPYSIKGQQFVTVTAACVADPSKRATARLRILPRSGREQ